MKSSRKVLICTSFFQKIGLIILGVFLALLLIECGMRIIGGSMLAWQQYQNWLKLKVNGAYRILCLGESTTAGEYPPLLEQELNRQDIGIRFTVIDGGREGTNTSIILKELEADLDRYRPDMVIAMMGINDFRDFSPQESGPAGDKNPVHFLKIYKLFRFAKMHLAKKMEGWVRAGKGSASSPQGKSGDNPPAGEDPGGGEKGRSVSEYNDLIIQYREQNNLAALENALHKVLELDPNNIGFATELSTLYQSEGRLDLAEEQLRKNIARFPTVTRSYVDLGILLGRRGHNEEAAQIFEQAHNLDPGNPGIMINFVETYHRQDLCAQAEDIARRALALYPDSAAVRMKLGEVILCSVKFSESEKLLKSAIQLDPRQDRAYFLLGLNYISRGLCSEAEEPLRKAISLKVDREYYNRLSEALACQGKHSEATEVYQEYLKSHSQDDRVIGEFASTLFTQGRRKEFEEVLRRFWNGDIPVSRSRRYHPVTVENFLQMRHILAQRNIRFVCMQYPVREIKYLKEIFDESRDIVFVDNAEVFREAVLKDGLARYFNDMFAGDFGHCSPVGNQLLAENIAWTILKEVFHKQYVPSPHEP